MAVRIQPLGSGSSGNATLIEFSGVRVLVDAGVAARTLAERLRAVGVEPSSLAAILLSHEHHDHACGLARFSLKERVPVCSTAETLEALDLSPAHVAAWRPIAAGSRLDLGPVQVDVFEIPHDAARPVAFVLEGDGVRVGVATDLGHATTVVIERLRGCHALVLEANHDDAMLQDGPYPWHLKQRVGGRMGHLSNDEAARVLERVADDSCRGVVLAHLSERNNTPALARDAAGRALERAGCRRVEMRVAAARRPTPALYL